MKPALLIEDLGTLARLLETLPADGLGRYVRVLACVAAGTALEAIAADQNRDPVPILAEVIGQMRALAALAVPPVKEMAAPATAVDTVAAAGTDHTRILFENAWTTFGDRTYDHSLSLVRKRLSLSGFDETWFRGKRCFDGGCGTGRVAVAMALAGAERVVAVDVGEQSLAYLKRQAARHGLTNIDVVAGDVTDLARWPDQSFDFVVSNGVLHHTTDCLGGLREHFRITRVGGVFWLYLYGAGGLYWDAYDALRPALSGISAPELRAVLAQFQIREGLIYTLLDNLLAPRTYHRTSEVVAFLAQFGTLTWRHARGSSEIDDTETLLGTAYGPSIYGPEGEVRVVITRTG